MNKQETKSYMVVIRMVYVPTF